MVEEFRFAKDIESMIEFRKSAGLSVCATRSMSKMLREYCLSQRTTRPRLTKEVAAGWLAWESEKGRKGLSHKATFLRLLARFINATGGSAYELPVVCTPKNNGFSPHIFSNDEPSRLFQEIDRYEDRGKIVPHGTYPVLFRTIYTCGLRPGEGYRIRLGGIDLSSGRILIRATKRHRERTVVASDDLRKLISRFIGSRTAFGSTCLFPRTDGRELGHDLARDVFLRCWARACLKAGVMTPASVRVYDLRHRFASAVLQEWQDKGLNMMTMIPYLRTYMGHEHIESTLYYAHLSPQRLSNSDGIQWNDLDQLIPEIGHENA